MLISREEILGFIRSHYPGYENYSFGTETLIEEGPFIIINDIHKIDESRVDLEKDIFVCHLIPQMQTNTGTIRLLAEVLNSDGSNSGEEIYQALEEHNPQYSKNYLKNGAHWVTGEAFFIAVDQAKEILGTRNPRSMFDINKFVGLHKNLFDATNVKLNLVDLRLLYELFFLEVRKVSYDFILQPVTTHKLNLVNNTGFETLLISKYFRNFELHQEMRFDHEFQVNGLVSGLAARKKRPFADVRVGYYCFDLLSVLSKDYAYLGLRVGKTDAADGTLLVNGKPAAHRVLLKKIKLEATFAPAASLMASMLAGKRIRLPRTRYIYDHQKPLEIGHWSQDELQEQLQSGQGMLVYHVDETIYEESHRSIIDTVVEKGEMYNAKYTLSQVRYANKPKIKNIIDYAYFKNRPEASQAPLDNFTSSKNIRQIQMVKLFETLVKEREFALLKAQQAEDAKKELEKLNLSLEQKVDDRTKALRLAVNQIESEKEQKTMFFINLAHEIKTPLTIIKSGFDSLRENVPSPQEKQKLDEIGYHLDLLLRNILNFMDAEKLQKGLLVYDHQQTVNFSEFTNKKLALFKQLMEKKQLKLNSQVTADLFLRADIFAVDRIINNLLDNAVKYNVGSGSITVQLSSREDKIQLRVEDTGIGIESEQLAMIFQPYYQISHPKRNVQGIGMGLFIVAEIIRSLKGEIHARSHVGQGSCFEVLLPRYFPGPTESPAADWEALPLLSGVAMEDHLENLATLDPGQEIILVVEDNPSLLKYLKEKMENDYNILCARNGLEALDILEKYQKPDLILSDVMMDNMDGPALLQRVKAKEGFGDIPFLFLTAKSSEIENLEGLAQGALDYINKPFSISVLLAKLQSILNFQRLKQSAMKDNKAASLGRLASGIAHEILNPLSGIAGSLEFLKSESQQGMPTGPEAREAFRYIEENIQRIEMIVKDLRSLIYEKSDVREDIPLRPLLESLLRVLDQKIRQRIDISLDLDESLVIRTNRAALTHICLNLLNNAVDSIPGNGQVRISAAGTPDNYHLHFSDTGAGIPKKYLDDIFNRNFTTKGAGKGTGFGLYLVKELSERLGLTIHMASQEQKGTEVTLRYQKRGAD